MENVGDGDLDEVQNDLHLTDETIAATASAMGSASSDPPRHLTEGTSDAMDRATRLANYLREQARWRGDKADEYDDDRNTQSGLALLDAAEYIEQLHDDDPRLVRLDQARCFTVADMFVGGEEIGHVVRLHRFHGPTGSPSQFLDDLAAAAERDVEQDADLD